MICNPLAGLIDFRLRPGVEGDLGYVLETWSRSCWPLYQHETRLSVFRSYLKRYLTHLLANEATLTVAADAESPSVIYGWQLSTSDVIRYAYVRSTHRRLGIARALTEHVLGTDIDTIYTSSRLTPDAQAIAKSHEILLTPFNER
jgi:GNAT superfamily N-acetyltransferase